MDLGFESVIDSQTIETLFAYGRKRQSMHLRNGLKDSLSEGC